MKGVIVYDSQVAKEREWYIKKYTDAFAKRGIELSVKTDRSVCDVDFVIMRKIDPKLSEEFEKAGTRVFNSHLVSKICNDKAATYEFIQSNTTVPILPYKEISQGDLIFPGILKAKAGHGGTQVYWCDSMQQVEEALENEDKRDFIIQQVCSDAGTDVRVYVIGGRIVVAMKREAVRAQDIRDCFKSNYCLGGMASVYEPDEQMLEYVSQITRSIKLDFAGIDFIFHNGKPVFNEIEDVVGARMIYDLTDIDIVEQFVDYITNEMRGNGYE